MDNAHNFQRSNCPIAASLDLFGDRWTLLLIRDLFYGPRKFSDFSASPEKIPTNILSDRLKRLVENGIAEKHAYCERPKRYEYKLTERGRALGPVLKEIALWANAHIPGTVQPAVLKRKPRTG